MRWMAIPILASVLVGCGPRPSPVAPATGTLADICATPRAAERPPVLTEVVPDAVAAWLEPFIPPAADAGEARARAESALASFQTMEQPGTTSSLNVAGTVLLYLQLLEAAYLLEGLWPGDAVEPPADLVPLLEPIYDGLRLPTMFAGGLVQQLGGVAAQLLAGTGAPNDVLVGALQLLRVLPERARVLHRHVALPLVCDPSADPSAALDALRHLADAAGEVGDYPEGLALWRAIARRAPADVDFAFALALAAYRAGQVDEGDQARAAADGRCPAPCAERPSDLDRVAEAARVLASTDREGGVEERLALARALETLTRADEASTLYETIAEELPDDARPRTGLARLAMVEALDVATALPLLETAGPDNRDGEYWELLVACRAMAAMYVVLPQIAQVPDRAAELLEPTLRGLHEALTAYMEFQPARALSVLLLLEAAEQALASGASDVETAASQALADVTAGALPLAERYPDSPDTARLLVAAALFGQSADQVFGALERPLPGELSQDVSVATRRAGLYLHAILRWGQLDRFERAAALIDEIPATTAGELWRSLLRADLLAVRWRLQPADVGPQAVADAFASLAENEALAKEQRPRVLNNLAVALDAVGDPGAAAERLRRAEDLGGDDTDVDRFNRAALAARAPSPPPEALESLRNVMTGAAAEEQPTSLRRQALRWLGWLAGREGRTADAEQLRAQADALPRSPIFPDPLRSDLGFIARGNFQFGLGYSSLQGLLVNLDTSSWFWLVLTPPEPR